MNDLIIPESIKAGVDALLAPYGFSMQQLLTPKQEEQNRKDSAWIKRREAACFAKVSCDTIDNWCREGHIRFAKLNDAKCGRILIDRNSLERFILKRCNSRRIIK